MLKKEDFTNIGYIVRSHALAGECVAKFSLDLNSLYDDENKFFLFIDIDDCLIPFRLEEYRYKSLDNVFLSFSDIDTKEKADTLCNKTIWIENNYISDNIDDEDIADLNILQGFRLYNSNDNTNIGYIESIDTSTINTLARVIRDDNSDILIPLAIELIESIDSKNKSLYLNIPNGLLQI